MKNGKLAGYWTEETNEPGVYCAGDWVGTHQLADASLGSAKRSSELLIAHLKIDYDVPENKFQQSRHSSLRQTILAFIIIDLLVSNATQCYAADDQALMLKLRHHFSVR